MVILAMLHVNMIGEHGSDDLQFRCGCFGPDVDATCLSVNGFGLTRNDHFIVVSNIEAMTI